MLQTNILYIYMSQPHFNDTYVDKDLSINDIFSNQ